MQRYSGSEDVYRELVEDSDDNWLFGLVAFAVFEEQRIEWMKHYERHNGRPPSSAEVVAWYQQQPSSVLLRAKGTAENALTAYSAEVVELAVDDKRSEIEESIIVGEIRELKRFWPQFGVNLAGGFASALLFAVALILFAFLVLNDISPVKLGAEIQSNIEVLENGKKQGSNE